MPTWTVPADAGKLRLDVFAVAQSGLPRHQVQRLIKSGAATINGQPAKSVHEWLSPGGVVTLGEAPGSGEAAAVPKVRVLAQTPDYVAIEKPAGIAVHGGAGVHGPTVVDWLLKEYPGAAAVGDDPIRPGIVHRLDKPVSGCMVVALTQQMFDHLKQQFTGRQVRKSYVALVYGVVRNDSGTVDVPIGRSDSGRFAAHTGSRGNSDREAVTEWEVLRRYPNATLLSLHPVTGRTHQLRVHCKFLGHSIVGDAVYVTRKQPYRLPPLDRLFLHAAELGFTDLAGEQINVSCPLPAELEGYLAAL